MTPQSHPKSMIFMSFESDFLSVISSNLSYISQRLATIHPWQTTTDRETDGRHPCRRRLQHSCTPPPAPPTLFFRGFRLRHGLKKC